MVESDEKDFGTDSNGVEALFNDVGVEKGVPGDVGQQVSSVALNSAREVVDCDSVEACIPFGSKKYEKPIFTPLKL